MCSSRSVCGLWIWKSVSSKEELLTCWDQSSERSKNIRAWIYTWKSLWDVLSPGFFESHTWVTAMRNSSLHTKIERHNFQFYFVSLIFTLFYRPFVMAKISTVSIAWNLNIETKIITGNMDVGALGYESVSWKWSNNRFYFFLYRYRNNAVIVSTEDVSCDWG